VSPLRVAHEFEVAADEAVVWRALADVPAVLACIPGTRVVGTRGDGRYDAAIGVRYGAIGLEFRGVAEVRYDDAARVVHIAAKGRDRSGATHGAADLSLGLEQRAAQTRLRLGGTVDLSGALAQVPAAGAYALVDRLMSSFGDRLAARIEGRAE